MRVKLGLLGLLAVIAAPAMAQDVVTNPDWLRKPTAAQLQALWPTEALKRGQSGKATIQCEITAQGMLRDCIALAETPEGAGFGRAAIALSAQFVMKPMTVNGKAVAGGQVRIPINFSLPSGRTGSHLRRGPELASGRTVLTNIPWRRAPTYGDVVAAFPTEARDKGVAGSAAISCRLDEVGVPKACQVMQETPRGRGFGDAARALAARFQAPETYGEGLSTKGKSVHIVFAFPLEMLQSAEPLIGKPNWARLPTPQDVTASYPAGVNDKILEGRAVLSCRIDDTGALGDCRVTSEQPAGQGLGQAAMALSKTFGVSLWTSEGLPTIGGRVSVPVRYQATAQPPGGQEGGGAP